MYQDACFPSLTASTVVLQYPPRSPPQNTAASLVCIVSVLISGTPQDVSFTGAIALATEMKTSNTFDVKYVWTRKVPTLIFLF